MTTRNDLRNWVDAATSGWSEYLESLPELTEYVAA
jgi:hypothetical protein